MNETNQKMSAEDLEALLPWYAAGTLDQPEADQIEAALATDTELARRLDLVREEMTEAILLNEALGVPSARVMETLFKAIDKERKTARSPMARGGLGWLADLFTPRAFAFAAGAAVIVIMLQAGVIAKLVLQDRADTGSPSFDVASAPAAPTRGFDIGSFALVRFTPQASITDISRFLDSRHAVIVDGPRPGGPGSMYKVRLAPGFMSKDDLDRLVKEFQSSSNLVIMAVPTE
jgi:hypothetical protein